MARDMHDRSQRDDMGTNMCENGNNEGVIFLLTGVFSSSFSKRREHNITG